MSPRVHLLNSCHFHTSSLRLSLSLSLSVCLSVCLSNSLCQKVQQQQGGCRSQPTQAAAPLHTAAAPPPGPTASATLPCLRAADRRCGRRHLSQQVRPRQCDLEDFRSRPRPKSPKIDLKSSKIDLNRQESSQKSSIGGAAKSFVGLYSGGNRSEKSTGAEESNLMVD